MPDSVTWDLGSVLPVARCLWLAALGTWNQHQRPVPYMRRPIRTGGSGSFGELPGSTAVAVGWPVPTPHARHENLGPIPPKLMKGVFMMIDDDGPHSP